MNPEREAFLAALKEDIYDQTSRLIFADWLDDHDEPELAEFHRSWTAKAYREAKSWMLRFAKDITEEDHDEYETKGPVTIDKLVEAGWENVRNKAVHSCLSSSGHKAEILMDQEDTRKSFWKHWQMLTEHVVTEEQTDGTVFRCCA